RGCWIAQPASGGCGVRRHLVAGTRNQLAMDPRSVSTSLRALQIVRKPVGGRHRVPFLESMKHGSAKRSPISTDSRDHAAWFDETTRGDGKNAPRSVGRSALS